MNIYEMPQLPKGQDLKWGIRLKGCKILLLPVILEIKRKPP